MKFHLIAILFVFLLLAGTASAQDYPNGYTHRPIMELFTSTSCVYCMRDADPAIAELWAEEGNTPEQPWTFVAFHQTNGGAGDDPLVTEESQQRMDEYLVTGTPDAQFDGGYIDESGGGDDVKDRYDQAFDDSGARDDDALSLVDFKEIIMTVHQQFDGTGFQVNVTVEYPIDAEDKFTSFDGELQVFMAEDNIWVYSSYLEEMSLQHNVFRGYAIEDMQVTLNQGESANFVGRWEIPTDAKVPVNPLNVFAVAAVYDHDDTSSQRGGDGNQAQVPRASQSTTPKATAWDLQESPPEIPEVMLMWNGRKWEISAYVDDEDNLTSVWMFYNLNGTNSTDWESLELLLPEEACTDGTCVLYSSGYATATLDLPADAEFTFKILAYDGEGTEAQTDLYASTSFTGQSPGSEDESDSKGLPIDPTVFVIAMGLALVMFHRKRKD